MQIIGEGALVPEVVTFDQQNFGGNGPSYKARTHAHPGKCKLLGVFDDVFHVCFNLLAFREVTI